MYNVYWILRSVTPAQKASAALNRIGLQHRLLRAPRILAPEGCAYALTLRERDLERARILLEREAAPAEAVYLRLGDGTFQRVGS